MNGYKECIPDHLNPDPGRDYLAKSQALGGDTLAEHTWTVLCRLHDQYQLRHDLARQMGDERLWHRLYWGCFLHDFGKAAAQFQERLQNPDVDNEWKRGYHRHEVLSLAFVDWLFPSGNSDRLPVTCIIASHHKDAGRIFDLYGAGQRRDWEVAAVEFLVEQITPKTEDHLWQWLVEFGPQWQRALGFPPLDEIQPIRREVSSDSIQRTLDEFARLGLLYKKRRKSDFPLEAQYRGLIFTADHSASAGAPPFPPMSLTAQIASKPLTSRGLDLNDHQRAAAGAKSGSMLLIAPTGSGKTEASLMWAARQLLLEPASRLFYTLPYQASMNAMAQRLAERFFGVPFEDEEKNQHVTIQHSRATLRFYELLMNADSGTAPSKASQQAKRLRDKTRLNYYPVQVFSPYQMLKVGYQLKGYEALLVDFTGALFIFDEIHAYEPERLALIITMIGWLAQNYRTRFLVMTATLPPMIRQELLAVLRLSDRDAIAASPKVFEESQRHTVHILDSEIADELDRIVKAFRGGQAVLVCCNQVARAQDIYHKLLTTGAYQLTNEDVMLLHGRFNGKDRNLKEEMLAAHVGVGATLRRPMIVVATQVVEVSLDVDFDVLYTEPAPLSALIQRFGRVNRAKPKRFATRPVHVMRRPSDDEGARPYQGNVVRKSLEVLEQHCQNKPIDEAQVTAMLDEIYTPGSDITRDWREKYETTVQAFRRVLADMQPYQSADDSLRMKFYELFDGTQVLPAESANDFYDAMEAGGFLAASRYLVNVSWGQFKSMQGKCLVQDEDDFGISHVAIPYDSETGLDIAGALQQKDDDV